MKKIAVIIVLIVLAIGVVAYADSVPQGVIPTLSLLDLRGQEVIHWVWTFEVDGATCVFVGGELDCFCPCDVDCNPLSIIPTTKPPTNIPPTEPPLIDTPVPPTEKPKCNRGIGNGSENCDPGNSSGQGGGQGRGAGEDRKEGDE